MRSEFLCKSKSDSLPFPDADNSLRPFIALYAEPRDIQTRSAHGTFLIHCRSQTLIILYVHL